MTKQPYSKAMCMSLLIHSVILAILVILGHMTDPISYAATPIEVEFIAPSVFETGQTLTDSNSPALDSRAVNNRLPVATGEHLQKQVVTKAHSPVEQSSLPDAQVGGEATVVQTSPTGLAGSPSSTTSGNVGNPNAEKTNGGQQAKSSLRTKASHLSGVRPTYPYEARRAGWEGTVVIRILVGIDGVPLAVAVGNSSGYSALDEAAAQAVKNWRFSPARQGDNPIESYYDVRVKFNLADEQ